MNPLTPKQIRSLIDMWADIHDEKEEEVVEVETTEESVSEEPLDEVNMGLQTGLKGFTDMVVGGAKGLGKVLQTGAQQVGGAAKTVEKKRPAVQGAVGNAAKAASGAVSGAVGGSPSIQGLIGKAVKNFADTVAPPPERSNEPSVRSGERTPQTGMNYVPSRDKSGERYDKTGTIAPAKLDPGISGSTMSSNPQFRGAGANTVKKVSYPTASQTQAAATPAPTPAPAATPAPKPVATPVPTRPVTAATPAAKPVTPKVKPAVALGTAAAATGGYNPRTSVGVMKYDKNLETQGGKSNRLAKALSGKMSDFQYKMPEAYDVVLRPLAL